MRKTKRLGVGESKADYRTKHDKTSRSELQKIISEMEKQMKEAAKNLDFEKAAALRDEMYELKAILADDAGSKPWAITQVVGERKNNSIRKCRRIPSIQCMLC